MLKWHDLKARHLAHETFADATPATAQSTLNSLADIKSAGVLHFASELALQPQERCGYARGVSPRLQASLTVRGARSLQTPSTRACGDG